MRNPWRLFLMLLLLVGGALLAPSVRCPIFGWLRGEAFYDGMPTSYWRSEITRLNRPPSWTAAWLERVGVAHNDSDYLMNVEIASCGGSIVFVPQNDRLPRPLLTGDRGMIPVVIALLRSDDRDVQVIAARLLGRFGAQAGVAAPALRDLARVNEGRVRKAALAALAEIELAAAKRN